MSWRTLGSTLLFMAILGMSAPGGEGANQDAQAINQAIRNRGVHWTVGETSVSRLSPEEQAKRCGAFLEAVPDGERMAVPVSKILLPAHFDWRDVAGDNWTTPIRDQGSCGSCWDFSAIGVLEALLDIASGNPADTPDEDLSEQYVLSCCIYCGSCGGGGTGSAFQFLQEVGAVTEACLPYEASDVIPCESACGNIPQRIGAWSYIYNDVESIKRAIYQYGPLSACFTVYEDFFYYTSGVYEHVAGNAVGGHAISIAGWDDADQAWICKNSWGTEWGETPNGDPYPPGAGNGGWFRIKWGNCGINDYVLMATLTSWPAGVVTVTVLDGLGRPVEGTEVFVNGSGYGVTSRAGTLSVDLIEGMSYEILALGFAHHFVLVQEVVAPGAVTLDCRDASFVTATATGLDGSPLDVGLYVRTSEGQQWCPEHTYGGTGWFYVTPGVYDLQAMSWWDSTRSDRYNLSLQDVDLTSSTSISIDARTLPTGRFVLQTLLGFSALELVVGTEGGWGLGARLKEGDSIICSPGNCWTYMTLIQEEGEWIRWYYQGAGGGTTLDAGQIVAVEGGGALSLFVAPDLGSYEPGTWAQVSTQMKDGFGNPIAWVSRSDDTPLETPLSVYRLGPDVGLEALQRNGAAIPKTWENLPPWMVVTAPSLAKLVDGETCLGCTRWIDLRADAELGPYSIHVTQETHAGELEGISSFQVVHPGSCSWVGQVAVGVGWRMISIPGQLCEPCTWMSGECGDLCCALGDDLNPIEAFRYDAALRGYVSIPPADQICHQAGMGMWICTRDDSTEIDAEVVTPTGNVELLLQNGWNQIGNPYTFAIGAGSIRVECGGQELSLLDAQAQGWISATLYGYDTIARAYTEIDPSTGCLPAWAGCWIQTLRDDCTLVFQPVGCALSASQARPLSAAEASALELPPPPPFDPRAVDVKEVLAGLSVRNVPNPIRSEYTTVFRVEGSTADFVGEIRVEVYDQNGTRVFTQRIAAKELTWHTVNDVGELLANGVYLYQIWVRVGEIWYPMEIQKLAVVR